MFVDMKDNEIFKEIGRGVAIWIMICLMPIFVIWEFLSAILSGLKKNKNSVK